MTRRPPPAEVLEAERAGRDACLRGAPRVPTADPRVTMMRYLPGERGTRAFKAWRAGWDEAASASDAALAIDRTLRGAPA